MKDISKGRYREIPDLTIAGCWINTLWKSANHSWWKLANHKLDWLFPLEVTVEYSLFENYDRDVASTIYASYSRYEIWMKQIAKKYHAIFLLTAPIIKAGKDNVTILTPGLFGCKKISFQLTSFLWWAASQGIRFIWTYCKKSNTSVWCSSLGGVCFYWWVHSLCFGVWRRFKRFCWSELDCFAIYTSWISARNCGVGSMDYRNRVYYYQLWKGSIQESFYFLLFQASDKGKNIISDRS